MSHEGHGLARLAVVDVVPLLQTESMFCTDAAVVPGCPLVNKRLDGSQQSRVFGRRRDVQVEVAVAYRTSGKTENEEDSGLKLKIKHQVSPTCPYPTTLLARFPRCSLVSATSW